MNNVDQKTNKTLTLTLRLLEIVLQSLVFVSFSVMILLAAIGLPGRDLWKCFLVIIPVIATYLIRRYIQKFQLNVILYLLIVASSLLLGTNESEYFFFALILLLVVCYSFRQKMLMNQKADISSMPISDIIDKVGLDNDDERNRILNANEQISVFYGASMVIGYMIGEMVKSPVIKNTEVVLFVLFVLLQVIYNNLKTLNTVFIRNRGKSEFPAEQIKRVNTFIIITLIFLMFLGMMVFYHGDYGNIFGLIGAGSMALLKAVLRIILMIWGSGKGEQNPVEEQTKAALDDDLMGSADSVGTSPILQVIGVVLTIIIFAAVICGAIYMFIRFIKDFNKARHENKDIVEYVKPLNTKSVNKVVKKEEHTKYAADNNLKYRKQYKKRVLKGYGKDKPQTTIMPSELTRKAITQNPQEATEITHLYEKARYSDESLTSEEVNIIKKHS